MGEKLEAMWVVIKYSLDSAKPSYANKMWLFRTRAAARKYAIDKSIKASQYAYSVQRATWGPEQ